MYFDPMPKTRKEDLFGSEERCKEIVNALQQHRLIVIRGLRRTGKTSILNVVYNGLKHPKSFVDSREIAGGRASVYEHFGKVFYDFLKEASMVEKAKSYVYGLDSFVKLRFNDEKNLSELAKKINSLMGEKNEIYCLFIDEAQFLKPSGFDRFLAFVFDKLERIKIVLAGSEIGVLDEFLGADAESPLYGRAKKIIELKRFRREESIAFLKAGFKQLDVGAKDAEIEDAVNSLDGVVGWLAYYGFYRKEYSHNKALSKALDEGSKIVAAEIGKFLDTRMVAKTRYLLLFSAISTGSVAWAEIRNFLATKGEGNIPDSRLANLLSQLQEYGFVEESESKYVLADPLIREAVKRL